MPLPFVYVVVLAAILWFAFEYTFWGRECHATGGNSRAAFLGATAIRPGRFNAVGTVVGIYLLAAGITGLQLLGAQFYVEQLFNGGALLIALILSAAAASRSGRARPT